MSMPAPLSTEERLARLELMVCSLMDLVFVYSPVRSAFETGMVSAEGRTMIDQLIALRKEIGIPMILSPVAAASNPFGSIAQQ